MGSRKKFKRALEKRIEKRRALRRAENVLATTLAVGGIAGVVIGLALAASDNGPTDEKDCENVNKDGWKCTLPAGHTEKCLFLMPEQGPENIRKLT